MAKVKSFPCSSTLNLLTDDLRDDACSRSFSFEDCESPPKHDFDPLLGIGENGKISLNKQPFDKGYPKENEIYCELSRAVSKSHIPITDNDANLLELLQKTDTPKYNSDGSCQKFENTIDMAPNKSSCDMVVNVSLSALAENHLKLDQKSQTSTDFFLDTDFSFSDLLSDISDRSVPGKSSKSVNSNENSDLFGLSFSARNGGSPKLFAESERMAIDNDLSILLESCETNNLKQSGCVSLADLANSHFLADSSDNLCDNLEENLTDELKSFGNRDGIDYELPSSLEDILSPCETKVIILKGEPTLADILNIENPADKAVEGCEKADPDIDLSFLVLSDVLKVENPVNKMLERCEKEEILSITDSSDDEIVPDIDLSFCVKKHKNTFNENFTLTSSSPESIDSGFDETNFISLKNSPIFQDFVSSESASYLHDTDFKSPLINANQSLLSKAISCKVNSSKTKSERLKTIKKDLFKKHFPTAFVDCIDQCPEIYKRIEDQSNRCVISCS